MAHSAKRGSGPQPEPPKGPRPPKLGELYTGIFQGGSRRGGFVVLETPGMTDVFVPERACGAALHGDQVRVAVVRHPEEGRLCEGMIERVLRHANKKIIGQIRRQKKLSIVTPKNPKIGRIIEIHRVFPEDEVPDRSWVEVEIRDWPSSPDEPLVGRLTEVIGGEDEPRLPILLLIREGGISPDFPEQVEAEALAIHKAGISPAEFERRTDLRGTRVMTIDPATAKDFDDAVSLVEKTGRGWRVGVHIADVGHYVKPGSAIDLEAFDRATSIYPVDRVVPMLPETLSNELCSLRPGEDRLTMTAFFDVSEHGEVSRVELAETVIHSVRRFTYEEVQGVFDKVDGIADPKHPAPVLPQALLEDLLEIRAASAALQRERMRRGSLDLDLPELEIKFDPEGEVESIGRKERLESHRLIEDLMVAANEAVARELTEKRRPTLYRIHEEPDADKLAKLAPAFSRFGISFKAGDVDQLTLQKALDKARSHPAGAIVQRLVLRSMKRAVYQPRNEGHYGLASACYAHFTSPIRRYPDLIVHRGVKGLLKSRDAGLPADASDLIEEWGRHCSQREQRAQRIEWDAQKILTLQYMRRFIGDVFEGFIGGMMMRGMFIELIDFPAEGFVPVRTMGEDFFDLDETGMAFHGRSTGKVYALGDRVTVQIERIDVLAGEMDLRLLRQIPTTAQKKATKSERKAERKGGKGKGKGKGDKKRRKK